MPGCLLKASTVPVEQTVPALVPYIELADGKVIVATDGADEIAPAGDARSLKAVWKRWAVVGGKSAQFLDAGLTTTVTWKIEGKTLTRTESIAASQPKTIRRFSVMFPSSGDRVSTTIAEGRRIDRFESSEGAVEVSVPNASTPLTAKISATANTALGKGSRSPVPMILQFEANDIEVKPATPLNWTVSINLP